MWLVGAASFGCGGWDALPPEEPPAPEPPPPPPEIRVVGDHLEDRDGNRIFLRGVNRSGTEYRCVQADADTSEEDGFFDGPGDEDSIRAMASWNINAVRVPLNETCWLGINGVDPRFSGENYHAAIREYVRLLHQYGLIPILDLHWAAPAEYQARRLQPMPNADHSPDFWRSVAETFKDDERVVFELFNEPFPHSNADSNTAWDCWRDGCSVDLAVRSGETSVPYLASGMQELVTAVRETGARHLLLLGGVQYSNTLSQWLEHRPVDPIGNLAAAWHVYNTNPCRDVECWNGVPAMVASNIPIVATEVGQNDCGAEPFVGPLLEFIDEHADGYLAWSWNAYGECRPPGAMPYANPWSLVTDYASGTPNGGYAETFYGHLETHR